MNAPSLVLNPAIPKTVPSGPDSRNGMTPGQPPSPERQIARLSGRIAKDNFSRNAAQNNLATADLWSGGKPCINVTSCQGCPRATFSFSKDLGFVSRKEQDFAAAQANSDAGIAPETDEVSAPPSNPHRCSTRFPCRKSPQTPRRSLAPRPANLSKTLTPTKHAPTQYRVVSQFEFTA